MPTITFLVSAKGPSTISASPLRTRTVVAADVGASLVSLQTPARRVIPGDPVADVRHGDGVGIAVDTALEYPDQVRALVAGLIAAFELFAAGPSRALDAVVAARIREMARRTVAKHTVGNRSPRA